MVSLKLSTILKQITTLADKAIRIAVLEGDFASLCALGLPLSLGVQLQQSCLKLSGLQDQLVVAFQSASSSLPLKMLMFS